MVVLGSEVSGFCGLVAGVCAYRGTAGMARGGRAVGAGSSVIFVYTTERTGSASSVTW